MFGFFLQVFNYKIKLSFSYLLETSMKNKQNRSSSFSDSKTVDCLLSTSFQKTNPATSDYLKEAKRIQNNAKQTSNTINLQFRKYSNKPEMSTVYVDSANVSKKLQQMNTRVNVNKYEMIIEVKKDAVDNLATKKLAAKDQIQHQKYDSIYKKFLKDEFTEKNLQITSPTIRLYQFYDEQDKDWKQNLLSKGLLCRQIVKQTQQKILQARSRKDDQSMSDSQVTPEVYNNYGNYDEMYDELVENNEIYGEKKLPVLNPQTIVLDRFQTKFYKCRQKKFEHIYSRVNEENKETIHSFSINSELNSPEMKLKNRKINLKIPQSCKQVYNAQNKLLLENISNGLSKDNTKKLIIQFNKTILDMKADDQQQKSQKKTNHSLNKLQAEKEPKLFKQLQKIRQVSTSHTKNFRLKKKPYLKKLSVNQMN